MWKAEGALTEIKTTPKKKLPTKEQSRTSGKDGRKAIEAQRQASKAVQLAFKIALINSGERGQGKRQTYFTLDLDAIKSLRKRVGRRVGGRLCEDI